MIEEKMPLDLHNASPIGGLEAERDGSFGVGVIIGGEKGGIFFEPPNTYCNKEREGRIKYWNVKKNNMEYFYFNEVNDLENFLIIVLENTEIKIREKFLTVLNSI